MSEEFNLPSSSYEELKKIVMGYSHAQENATLESLAQLTGVNKFSISGNSKFLTDVGIIAGGIKKSATELGKRLGRAIEHHQENDVQKYLTQAVQSNTKVASLITTLRIKNGLNSKDLAKHALYVSGQKDTSKNRAGAKCVVDLLKHAGLVEERDGKIYVAAPAEPSNISENLSEDGRAEQERELGILPDETTAQAANAPNARPTILPVSNNLVPQVAINIQLHLPETDNAEVYEKLFRALRQQLLAPET